MRLGDDGRDLPRPADVELPHRAGSADRALERAAVDRHPGQVLLAAVLHRRQDRAPVRRELRVEGVAVEGAGQDGRRAAGSRRHPQVIEGIDDGVRLGDGLVGDQASIRRERWRCVGAGVAGDLGERLLCCSRVGRDHPDVGVVVAVGVGGTVAREGDAATVGRPGGLAVVVVPRGDLGHGPGRDVEHVEVGAVPVEVADVVELELAAVDHPRRRVLRLLLAALDCQLLGGGVLQHQHHALAVRRPLVVAHPLRGVGQLRRLAALAIERPHLVLTVLGRGQERQVAAVRAPPRVRGRPLRARHRHRLPAGRRDHPDAVHRRILLEVGGGDAVGHPAPVRADLRLVDGADSEVVVNGQVPRRRRRFHRALVLAESESGRQ